MIGYKVDEQSLMAIVDKIRAMTARAPIEALKFVEDGIEIIYLAAQANVPVGGGGNAGALQRSMERYVFDIRDGQISGKVTMMNRAGEQKPYAWMREKGGTIVPRPENRIQRLVWTDDAGNVIFARQVTQQGNHYMEGALVLTKDEVTDQANIMLGRFVKFRD